MISRKSDAEAAHEAGADVFQYLADHGWGTNDARSEQRQDSEQKAGRSRKQRQRKKSQRTRQISFRMTEADNNRLEHACKAAKRKKGILIERAIIDLVARIERGEDVEW